MIDSELRRGSLARSIANRLEPDDTTVGQVGAHHFKFMANVRLLLEGYCVADRMISGLDAIPFDKLANLAARTWSAAGVISGSDDFSPIPYVELNGVHGPGQALIRHKGEGPCYVLSAFYRLQVLLPQRTMFDIRLPGDGISVAPTDYRTTVRPAIPHVDWDTALKSLGSSGGPFVEQLSGTLAPLEVDELRALGTHKTAESLDAALQYHWRRLRNLRAVIIDHIRAKRIEASRLQRDMHVSCLELRRKAADNQYRYERARTTVLDSLPRPSLACASFEGVHRPGAEIWCPAGLRDSRTRIHPVTALVDVLEVVVAWSSTAARTDVLHERLQEQLERVLREVPDHKLPNRVEDFVDVVGDPVSLVLQRLEALFARYEL